MHTPRVFISSTFRDLEVYRKEVDDICRMLNSQSITMEHFGSDHREPLQVCLEKVESADWLVGIYARRYGYVPPNETYSISELEYRHAVRHGKIIIAFVLRSGAEWPAEEPYTEQGEGALNLKRFTNQLVRDHIVREFSTKDELGKLVAIELGRYHLRMLKNEAIVNPLSSLPLPDRLLYPPQSPYVGLRHFSRREARVFYGRSQLIWTLYQKITNNPGSITLLYGQTGVGKSSLLDAGLTPRLEQAGWQVSYLRRERAIGLATQLTQAYQNLPMAGKPQLLILDQIEELWTNANPALPHEIIDFFVALQAITQATDNALKLVLSFRKEFQADVEKLLGQYEIYRENQFVESMDQRELAEAITQVQEVAKARELYQIRVSETLPHEMAFDLRKDNQSHIAPLLQVTLSRMWATARQDQPEGEVVFDEALYYRVRSESLDTFLHSRIDALRNTFGEEVQSGLVLDILHYFTTDKATAAQHPIAALADRYTHVSNLMPLLQALENQYLLIDPFASLKQAAKRLGHDALAPLVQKAYRMADTPGQQAARILDSKQAQIIDYGNTEPIFSESDLRTLGIGKDGMRIWTDVEETAYTYSLQAAETLQRTLRERQKLAIRALSNGLVKDAYLAFERKQFSQAIRLAQKAYEIDPNNWKAKERLINTHHHLPMLADLQGHNHIVNSAVFSPNGSYILTASSDRTVRLWDSQGSLIAILEGHEYSVDSAVFSPDGDYILTASSDKTARLWDKEGYLLGVLEGHTGAVNSAVFSPDQSHILTASDDGTARLWGEDGVTVLEGHNNKIRSAVFSPDGNRILTVSYEDKTTRLWDNQGVQLAVLEETDSYVYSAAFSPDGNYIITTHSETARLWDSQGQLLKVLEGHTSYIDSAVFSPDGSHILTASDDKTARLWDKQGKLIATLHGHSGSVYSALFSPDGSFILTSGSVDGTVRLWNSQGVLLAILEGHINTVNSAVFSPDGSYILTASADQTARLWDSRGVLLTVLKEHNNSINSAVFSYDGNFILTAEYCPYPWLSSAYYKPVTAHLWNSQGILLADLEGHYGSLNAVVFSIDSRLILTCGHNDETARLWTNQGELLAVLKGETNWITSAVFSADGSRILTGSNDWRSRLWNIQGNLIAVLEGHTGSVRSVFFSPDGDYILTASDDKTARVWDSQGNPITVLEGHKSEVWSAVPSPDGNQILTVSFDQTARLWDKQGQLLTILEGHTGAVTSGKFSPAGDRILTASSDGTARLWDNKGRLLAIMAGDNKGVLLAMMDGVYINSAVFSPDGSQILTAGSFHQTARLWDVHGKLIAVLEGHTNSVNSAVFSPDGNRILTASADKTARIWLLNYSQIINNVNWRGISILTWEEMKQYDIDSIEQSAGINRSTELLNAEPHEMSLYHYARYYYEIARTNSEDSYSYLVQSLRLYNRLIEHWPLNHYKQEQGMAMALLNASTRSC